MADTPPTYDPNADWRRGIKPVVAPARSYGGTPLGSAVNVNGFEYDEATLHDLAKQWTDLANDFQDDLAQANRIARAKGPGLEYASGGNAELVRASGDALSDTLKQRIRYCQSMAGKYVAALGKYATDEDRHATDISKQAGGSL